MDSIKTHLHNALTILTVVALGIGIGWWFSPRGEPPTVDTIVNQSVVGGRTFAPCANEDGSGGTLPCYWDADTQGNGSGVDVLNGYRMLDCGRFDLLVKRQAYWDEGCQPDDNGKPIALSLNSTIRVMGGER